MVKGKQIVFERKGKAALKDVDVPLPGAGQLLIENDYTVISAGTERANLIQLPNTVTAEKGFPHSPGYSGAGRVAVAGECVDGFKVGDRVVVKWGGHRSHTLRPAEGTVKIDDNSIDLLDAAFAPIAAFPMLGIRKLRIELGEAAMVVGQGILGAFAVQLAALCGAIPVLASDVLASRRDLARTLGAARVFDPAEEDVVERVREATDGEGPNVVVEVTGSAAALRQALEQVAWEGRISLLGCTRVSDVPIDFYRSVHKRGVSLIGAHSFTRPRFESAPGGWTERDDYRTFLKLLAAGKIQTRPVISEVVSPEQGPEVFRRLAAAEDIPVGIVFDWGRIR